MRSNGNSGFTLIEVMVSTTLMALVSVVVLLALRHSLTILEKGSTHLDRLHRTYVVHEILYEQISGAIPFGYTVRDGDRTARLLGFEGDRNHVRFVSRNSFKDGPAGFPRWVEIRWLANAKEGTGDLTAEERRILSPDNVGDSKVYVRENLLRANDCAFDFLKAGRAAEPPAWTSNWQPPRETTLPRAVRLTCLSESKQIRSVIPLDYAAASAAGLLLQ